MSGANNRIVPYYESGGVTLMLGDCAEVMRALPSASVDAIVTDPPYELGFMGKGWDGTGIAYSVEMWRAALRVLKPGGHLVAFGATRNYHRMAVAIEDAGFEIRDSLMWLYGSGFPKSLDVSKAIDRANGDERPVVGALPNPGSTSARLAMGDGWQPAPMLTSAASAASAAWNGWGTALKPAYEPIVLARKPLAGTVAHNVLTHGSGAINVDACRIDGGERPLTYSPPKNGAYAGEFRQGGIAAGTTTAGRWPANVLLDEEAAAILDAQTGELMSGSRAAGVRTGLGYHGADGDGGPAIVGSVGGASRFFYTAKASRSEREAGLDGVGAGVGALRDGGRGSERHNDHPTVKPVDVMAWLCRLVTPPGGLILDPFNGSGTTGMAALDEGFRYIGIDLEERYLTIARARIAHRHLINPVTVESTADVPRGRLL